MTLEKQDRTLVRRLQRDCRRSNQALAEETGMSASACWRRVKALEEQGVLTGYVALADTKKAGFAVSAIVHVILARHERGHVDTFVGMIRDREEVIDCFATTGEADYHLRVVAEDMEGYNAFLDDFLFQIPGVASVRTNIVLKEIKTGVALPV